VVVEEHDPARAQQPPQVVQVHEHGVESVVAIHDGQVEPAPLGKQPGQHDLRLFGIELHQSGDSGLA